VESKTLSRWSCEGHTTEGSFETICTCAQGKSKTICTQTLGMRKQIKLLEEMGYIRENPHSRWSLPVLIVSKPKLPDEFRMKVDTRYPNSQLVAIAGCSPILEVILQHLKLASVFSSLDAFKGFWQFPLDVDCQKIYSLLTDVEIFTPERTVQGSTDAAHAFQEGVYESMDSLLFLCVLIWIDDLLVYSKSFEQHLQTSRSKSCLPRVGGRYPRMEYRSILPTSRDLQSALSLKRLSKCSIYLALSTGLEAPFQTMPVK